MGHDALASYNLPFFQCLANKDIMHYIEILYSTYQPSNFVEAGKLVTNYQDKPSLSSYTESHNKNRYQFTYGSSSPPDTSELSWLCPMLHNFWP
jgi:hypothetical protein